MGTVLYAGIDEAGYGPMLGPLCVGLCAVEVVTTEADGVPDLWALLQAAVGRTRTDAKAGLIPVADSKALKGSNQAKTRHPCELLELGVLAFLAAADGPESIPTTDLELFERLGVQLGEVAWYVEPEPTPLPLGGSLDRIRIAANVLRREQVKAGVQLAALQVRAMPETEFNGVIREHGSKGAATSIALEEHLRTVRTMAHRPADEVAGADASAQQFPMPSVRIVADRQSGRLDYRAPIGRAWPGVGLDILEQTPRASVYQTHGSDCRVLLMPEAEDRHLPVALASMAAKLVRELAMARFNRYWASRLPELKPTAGYVQDARRWLHDASGVISATERAAMVRLA